MCPFPSSRNQPSAFRRSIESRIGFPNFFLNWNKVSARSTWPVFTRGTVKKNFHLEGDSVERDVKTIVGNFSSFESVFIGYSRGYNK